MRRLQSLASGAGLGVLLLAGSPCGIEAAPAAADDARAVPTPSLDPAPSPRPPDAPEPGPPAVDPVAQRVPWPPTTLPLAVLATLDDPQTHTDRATIRDADSGVIASYRAGDQIRDGVVVVGIENGVVELSHDDEVEFLSISPLPFEIDPKDVFYPDLIDDLGTEMGDAVQMPAGTAYVLKTPGNAWGTPRTIGVLREAIASYARAQQGPKVRVGDISRPGGGPFPPHLSHQEGRDVDVGYVLFGARKNDRQFHLANASNLDAARTWALLESLFATGEVAYVFVDYELQKLLYAHAESSGVPSERLRELFQYPNGRRASRGTIRDWKGHRGHFHVRFRR